MDDATTNRTFQQGYAAHRAGNLLSDNPYQHTHNKYLLWSDGWRAARSDLIDEAPVSMQVQRWRAFSAAVEKHITEYVIPQYGDEGTEPAKEYDIDDCVKQAQRYLARVKTSQREGEQSRDMIKAAHWVQKVWSRLGN